MRLLPLGGDVFEVHWQGHKIGKVWLYSGEWRAELNDGTPVRSVLGADKTTLGMEVERLHKRRL